MATKNRTDPLSALNRILSSDTAPHLNAVLAAGRELHDLGLCNFIHRNIPDSDSSQSCARYLLYTAARRCRNGVPKGTDDDDAGHARLLLDGLRNPARWRPVRGELNKFALLAREELRKWSQPGADLMAPGLTSEHFTILHALDEAYPEPVLQVDLEARTRLSRRTSGPLLKAMRDSGLVCRPEGWQRKGDTITPKGVAALNGE
jgi:hypothetical protein